MTTHEEDTEEGMDELDFVMTVFAGMVWRGATAQEAIDHIAKHGAALAPEMAARIDPRAGVTEFFRLVGRGMWDATPQPAHGFRLMKLPVPGRNDPCFCGSGHKYKQCCSRMPEFPLHPGLMLSHLLKAMPRKHWVTLAHSQVNRDWVLWVIHQWDGERDFESIEELLGPWFKGENAIRDQDAELLDCLLDAYADLDKPRKRKALAREAIERGENVVRSVGWQRIALMESDAGNGSAAHRALIEAQRADPNNPNLALLEVHMLISVGNLVQARERAKYWVLRLAKLGDPELRDQIAWLKDVVLDPQAAMMKISRQKDENIAELETLLKEAPPIECLYRLEPIEGSTGPLEPDAKLDKALKKWNAAFPSNPPGLIQMSSWNAEAWNDAEAWLVLLSNQPFLWNSFEVLDDLICVLDGYGMDWVCGELIPPMLERALALFDLVLLENHAEKLKCEWGWVENRPALRLLARKVVDGMASPDAGERESAFLLMHRFVDRINPNDNHGFRARVVAGLVERGRAGEAVAIGERYPDDLADMKYTHALALHAAGLEEEACETARFALNEYPKVGKFLLNESVRKPRNDGRDGYKVGSDEEAWLYREEFRPLWNKLDALPWLAKVASGMR